MTAREDLAEVIRDGEGTWRTPLEAADAILGSIRPRTITTYEDLAALPVESVILDVSGDVSQLRGERWCGYAMAHLDARHMAKYLPAMVLYEPQP